MTHFELLHHLLLRPWLHSSCIAAQYKLHEYSFSPQITEMATSYNGYCGMTILKSVKHLKCKKTILPRYVTVKALIKWLSKKDPEKTILLKTSDNISRNIMNVDDARITTPDGFVRDVVIFKLEK